MLQAESAYWDGVAAKVQPEKGVVLDNWSKRRLLGQFLLKCNWRHQKVLEIGVGAGMTAALLAFSCGNKWNYIGTDVSPKFAEIAAKYGLNIVQADVLSLPIGQFDRILALDSLEHVRLEDREQGYKEISQRLVKGGLLFINMPLDESLHVDEFDHGIGLVDLMRLEALGLRLHRYEHYELVFDGGVRKYAFVVMTK